MFLSVQPIVTSNTILMSHVITFKVPVHHIRVKTGFHSGMLLISKVIFFTCCLLLKNSVQTTEFKKYEKKNNNRTTRALDGKVSFFVSHTFFQQFLPYFAYQLVKKKSKCQFTTHNNLFYLLSFSSVTFAYFFNASLILYRYLTVGSSDRFPSIQSR